MEISLITDEISADPVTAIELGVSWGVHNFELRGYFSERVPSFTHYQKDKLQETLDLYQAKVVAISPGLFKFPFPQSRWTSFPVACIETDIYHQWRSVQDLAKVHLNELLPASIEYAKDLGAQIINVFSFHRGGDAACQAPDSVLRLLDQAAEFTSLAGLKLCIEVESGFWGDTGKAASQLLKDVGNPNLHINWDPANAFEACEVPFPTGYNFVKGKIAHIHFKDAHLQQNGQVCYVTNGDIDWNGQIQALVQDGYTGYISVETHMQPKVASASQSLKRLNELISANKENG